MIEGYVPNPIGQCILTFNKLSRSQRNGYFSFKCKVFFLTVIFELIILFE